MFPSQGYNRVSIISLIVVSQSLLELAGSVLVLAGGVGPNAGTLTGMGLVSLVTAALAALAGHPHL